MGDRNVWICVGEQRWCVQGWIWKSTSTSHVYLARKVTTDEQQIRTSDSLEWTHVVKFCAGAANIEDSSKRFEREIQVLEDQLGVDAHREPYVVAIADVVEPEVGVGKAYKLGYVMPKLSSLEDHLLENGGQLSEGEAVGIALSIARTMDFLWQTGGIVHRDIKPSNLLWDDSRCVWCIADFGIAKIISQVEYSTQSLVTDSDARLGTYGYMAPEQLGGRKKCTDKAQPDTEPEEPAPNMDVFGIGATLYRMLAGQAPFPRYQSTADQISKEHDVMRAVTELQDSWPARFLSDTNVTVSISIETIVDVCLKKAPSERFHTCGDLACELERIQGESPITSRRPTCVDRLWRRCQLCLTSTRGKVALTAVCLLGLMLPVLLVLFNGYWDETALSEN